MRIRTITVATVAGLALASGAGIAWATEPTGESTVVRILTDENGDTVGGATRDHPCPDEDGGTAQVPTETPL
jgi:hypothetical protein